MAKFAKGDRVVFVGDPATGSKAKGTVMQYIAGTFNQYEVHTDLGSVLHLKEEDLQKTAGGKSKDEDEKEK